MQNEGKHAVCLLCLTSCECAFDYVEAVTIEILRFLGLGLDLDISGRPVTCRTCSENLQKCFDFKTICIYTEDCINSFRNDRNNVNLDLREICLGKYENIYIVLSKCHTICRLCMEIAEVGCYIPINVEAKDVMSAKAILERCISELDLDVIKDPVICISCNESLYSYFNFIKSCLDKGNKIKKYSEIEESKSKPQEELKSVLQFSAENTSNHQNGYSDIDISKNCDGNESCNEIKLKVGNLAQRESQQLHVKHEINEVEEVDGIKIEKLGDTVEKYHENGQNREIELKCENSVKTESDEFTIKHEEIEIKTEEDDPARFQDNMFNIKDASALAIHRCKICEFETKYKGSLRGHLLVHRNACEVTMYSCQMCTYQTKKKGDLKRHMLIHKNVSELTMYSCEFCTYKAKQKYVLKRHMLIHKCASEVTMYSCERCTYQTKRKIHLRQHTLIHKNVSEVTMYSCEFCTYKAKHKYTLKRHMFIHSNTSDVTMYSCEFCTYKAKQKHFLNRHMLIHMSASEITMYPCEICTYQTKRKSHLREHMLIHKNACEVTVYSCEICTYKTKRKQNLNQHMLIHRSASEITMYSCEVCTYQTKHKSSLNKHMLIHRNASEITMYSCEKCTYQTRDKSNLRQHVLTHKDASAETTYLCELCTCKAHS